MNFPLFYSATVKSTKDPLSLGRVQIVLRGFSADTEPMWVRMVQPAASAGTGFFFLPEKNDEVIVLRGAGDVLEGMLILGCVYNGKNKPATPDVDDKNSVKEIRTKAGNAITFTDKAGDESISIVTKSGKLKIVLSEKGKSITIEGADEVIVDSKNKLTLKSKNIVIESSSSLKLGTSGSKVAIEGSGVDVNASGNVNIVGVAVSIG